MTKSEVRYIGKVQYIGITGVSFQRGKIYDLVESEEDKIRSTTGWYCRSCETVLIRVIDESGEDYLYPKDSFIALATLDEIAKKKGGVSA